MNPSDESPIICCDLTIECDKIIQVVFLRGGRG